MNTEQFVQVPTIDLKNTGLEMKDLVVYAYLRKHYNHLTKESFPSLETLSKESKISKPTILKAISRLESSGYIFVEKIGRINHYTFSDFKKFEIYSYDFLDDQTLTTADKAYIICIQPHMFKNESTGYGMVKYSDLDIARRLKIDLKTLKNYENHLREGDQPILTLVPTAKKDPETGLAIQERIFDFEAYNNILALKFQQLDSELESKVSKTEYDSTIKNLMNKIRELELQLKTTEIQPITL